MAPWRPQTYRLTVDDQNISRSLPLSAKGIGVWANATPTYRQYHRIVDAAAPHGYRCATRCIESDAREYAVSTEELENGQQSNGYARALAAGAIPLRLRVTAGKCAEVLVATSGVLALVVIVLIMGMMVRGIRLLHPQ
jgi:hypothetical protein